MLSLSYLILSLSYPTPLTLCKYDSDEAGEYEMGDWVGVHLDLDAGEGVREGGQRIRVVMRVLPLIN
jgi:hypothetical protein